MTRDTAPGGSGARAQDAARTGEPRGRRAGDGEQGLLGFVWRHSRREQLGLLALTTLSFPFVYLSLEVPKIIVNEAISGTDFPRTVAGVALGQIPYLLALCLLGTSKNCPGPGAAA